MSVSVANCQQCSSALAPNARFCSFCGSSVTAIAAEPVHNESVPERLQKVLGA